MRSFFVVKKARGHAPPIGAKMRCIAKNSFGAGLGPCLGHSERCRHHVHLDHPLARSKQARFHQPRSMERSESTVRTSLGARGLGRLIDIPACRPGKSSRSECPHMSFRAIYPAHWPWQGKLQLIWRARMPSPLMLCFLLRMRPDRS